MLAGIEDAPIYDGRRKGVDVYVCEHCGQNTFTRNKDKGVTPFVIESKKCRSGYALHRQSIGDVDFEARTGLKVLSWVRPTFEQFCKADEALRGHILQGGLVLEGNL